MRLGAIPETPLERLALWAGAIPTPLGDTMIALLLARTLMAACRVGVFDALATGPGTAADVAACCGTNVAATAKLLGALAGARYLQARNGRYRLAPVARRWLPSRARRSLHDAVLHRYLDLALLGRLEEFVATGRSLDFHAYLTPDQWQLYQRGQRAHAVQASGEVVRRIPMPRGARAMLDVGGAHGHYAAALCRRVPALRATVLDLPQALGPAAALLAAEGLGDRVTRRAGDARVDGFGTEEFDLVFMAHLVHHFTESQNRGLIRRAAHALRPGGYCVILEFLRPASRRRPGQLSALLDLYFALTSAGGTWTSEELAAWQRAAGLVPRRPVRLRSIPGAGLQIARKPGEGAVS